MTVSNVIERVKERKPNAYSDHMLVDWLNEIESMVQRELMNKPPTAITTYDEETDLDKYVLLPRPYDIVYITYIIAMIEFNQQEYVAYNNTMVMFNQQFDSARKYYNEAYSNTGKLKIKNWMR